jgi:hypothetical protein
MGPARRGREPPGNPPVWQRSRATGLYPYRRPCARRGAAIEAPAPQVARTRPGAGHVRLVPRPALAERRKWQVARRPNMSSSPPAVGQGPLSALFSYRVPQSRTSDPFQLRSYGCAPNESAHQLQAWMPVPTQTNVPQRAQGALRPLGGGHSWQLVGCMRWLGGAVRDCRVRISSATTAQPIRTLPYGRVAHRHPDRGVLGQSPPAQTILADRWRPEANPRLSR